jgi:uncharacterized protein (TIGR03086 family)
MNDVLGDHRQACDAFTAIARQVDVARRWASQSPCTEWDARAVVEHVIGFHDVLILRPLETKPSRPKDDPVARWTITVDALFDALAQPGAMDDKTGLVGVLTTDVLVHSWDLAKAAGVPVTLDPRLCRIGLDRALAHMEQFAGSDKFAPSVVVPDDADVEDRLLAFFGRNPAWRPPPRV